MDTDSDTSSVPALSPEEYDSIQMAAPPAQFQDPRRIHPLLCLQTVSPPPLSVRQFQHVTPMSREHSQRRMIRLPRLQPPPPRTVGTTPLFQRQPIEYNCHFEVDDDNGSAVDLSELLRSASCTVAPRLLQRLDSWNFVAIAGGCNRRGATVLPSSKKANSRISSRPKLHMLHHLTEDLDRFATVLHYESEKSEQFNKFIREHIYHTNRQMPSRDLFVAFGQQFMFRHIIDGGSWETDTEERVKAGVGIEEYLARNPTFRDIYLEADREYADNNESSRTLQKDLAGFFVDKRSGSLFLGRIERMTEGSIHLVRYHPNLASPSYAQ